MSNSTSILEDLLNALPELRSQIYFKPSLTALSHAMEDQVLAGRDHPLVIANFQRERFYRQEANRYLRISEQTDQVYVLAAPETDFKNQSDHYETIAFDPSDSLAQEWHLVVLGSAYASCLICRERQSASTDEEMPMFLGLDQARRFEGIWTFDRKVVSIATELLLNRVLEYRPELAKKISRAKRTILRQAPTGFNSVDPAPFAERLVTYLQAGQYKLLKAYRSIASQEQKERLVNSITAAIRRSLNLDDILRVAVEELGRALRASRCLIYCCKETDSTVQIQHEYLTGDVKSLKGQTWNLDNNPLFQAVVRQKERIFIEDAQTDPWLLDGQPIASPATQVEEWHIGSWLMVPVLHQNRLLGIVEVHHCGLPCSWSPASLELIEAIAAQIGVALIQAEAYTNLEDFNQQLEALDRTRSNLIAITGHELRTPLSTIQVCLESLASEPDMPLELQQVMLSSALSDAERMRKLIQDFLTLSQLESGRVQWHLEPLPLQECVDLALSSLRARQAEMPLPEITTQVSGELPLVKADGEWVVEVLSKLLDNACKFTDPTGKVWIQASRNGGQMLELTVTDTGRGIEPNRLEIIFDRFYQEEGALRRSTGGTGLGLAICRQIITGLGGQIWAESEGKDRGSKFHLTLPIFSN
ncbi:MAG: DICT sensory domain-containing protein [Leptolyngbyaceae cyanobacterium bins.302]|nr:DICT sensory domain-containing protein [Leptolyngbyaceae cyanobacterium bins.302]